MRSLIFALFAALLSFSSSASAQGTQPIPQPTPQLTPQPTPQLTPTPQRTPQSTPQPNPSPTPSTAASSQPTTPPEYMRAWPEPGRYHPCPASVGLPNGRTVCLGWDDERRRSRARCGKTGSNLGLGLPVLLVACIPGAASWCVVRLTRRSPAGGG